jgi:hypothetical protein
MAAIQGEDFRARRVLYNYLRVDRLICLYSGNFAFLWSHGDHQKDVISYETPHSKPQLINRKRQLSILWYPSEGASKLRTINERHNAILYKITQTAAIRVGLCPRPVGTK